MKITIGNLCFITNADSKKLLLLKRSRDPMKNLYTGVGGKAHFEEDIRHSCLREIKEETGLDVFGLKLKAVIKTILEGNQSSWILFVYIATTFSHHCIECDEGILEWVDPERLDQYPLIEFVQEIIPSIFENQEIIEATFHHDIQGRILRYETKL